MCSVTFPADLNVALEAYGRALFRYDRPRDDYVHTVLAGVDARRELRRSLAPAWDFADMWKSFFPGANRTALPEIILTAMTAVTFAWDGYARRR